MERRKSTLRFRRGDRPCGRSKAWREVVLFGREREPCAGTPIEQLIESE